VVKLSYIIKLLWHTQNHRQKVFNRGLDILKCD